MLKTMGTFVIALLTPISVLASTFSFESAVEEIRKNNYQLKSAQENLKASQNDKKAGYSNYLPKVNATLGYSKSENNEVLTQDGYSAGLNATLNLFNGMNDIAAIENLEGRVSVAEANLATISSQVSYDLKVAFANLVFANDSLALAESISKRRSENYAMIELRFNSGRENKGSVLLAKAQVQSAKLDVLRAKNAKETAAADLARVLGLRPSSNVEITGGVPGIAIPEVNDFLALANKTPQRTSAAGLIQSAEAGLKTARSGFMPTLNLNGSVGRGDSEFFPDRDERWNVGATLSWNLFNGGRDYFNHKSAFSQKIVAENNWSNTQLDLVSSLKKSYAGLVEAKEAFEVSKAFLSAGEVRAQITREKYNNGLSTFDEWDRIESDLISYQKDQTVKKRDQVIAEANWEKSQGIGVIK